jgi:hypothetical protein
MRGVQVAGALSAAIVVVGSLGIAPAAHATNYGVELNGTYLVRSDGEWAQTSAGPYGAGGALVYIDQPTVVQTWNLTSTCTSSRTCTGEVTSDQGWSAPLRLGGGAATPGGVGDFWVIERVVENWEPCPDGTAWPGNQKFTFYGWDPGNNQRNLKIVDLLVGLDSTKAASGACGINKPLVIEMPLRLEKLA